MPASAVTQALLKTKFYLHFEHRNEYMKPHLSLKEWWKSNGAFVEILPRQCGKTTAIMSLCEELKAGKQDPVKGWIKEGAKVLCCSENIKRVWLKRYGLDKDDILVSADDVSRCNAKNTHLFVDEFLFVDEKVMNQVYDMEWKSLNLISSLK